MFCATKSHAENVAAMLGAAQPAWRGTSFIHSGLGKRDRSLRLSEFHDGKIPILVAVDVLNEGVDVPAVNIICFLRVTHSRRIFVQQLGRGLRITNAGKRVAVLDFVSDIRRFAELHDLKASLGAGEEHLTHPGLSTIRFSDQSVESLVEEWIEDAADLAGRRDSARLALPRFEFPVDAN